MGLVESLGLYGPGWVKNYHARGCLSCVGAGRQAGRLRPAISVVVGLVLLCWLRFPH